MSCAAIALAAALGPALGPAFGPQAALQAEMFPTSVRDPGVSIDHSFGSIPGGPFAVTIAPGIIASTTRRGRAARRSRSCRWAR